MKFRSFLVPLAISVTLLLACAGPAPMPEPGMEVYQYGHGEEIQIAPDIDWGSYTKIILHAAPVEFRKNWQRDQELLHGKEIREVDVQRIKTSVSDQFANLMVKTLTEQGGYQLTSESGAGVLRFTPNIVDLEVREAGWVENSIVESLPDSRGSMTIELVIRDSVSDKLLAVAWQRQSDPRGGDVDMTTSVNNSQAFRLMIRSWANWLTGHLKELKQ